MFVQIGNAFGPRKKPASLILEGGSQCAVERTLNLF